jgi:hypothetical protein
LIEIIQQKTAGLRPVVFFANQLENSLCSVIAGRAGYAQGDVDVLLAMTFRLDRCYQKKEIVGRIFELL